MPTPPAAAKHPAHPQYAATADAAESSPLVEVCWTPAPADPAGTRAARLRSLLFDAPAEESA